MNDTVTYYTEKTVLETKAIERAEAVISLYQKAGYEVQSLEKNVVFYDIEFKIVFKKKGAKKK